MRNDDKTVDERRDDVLRDGRIIRAVVATVGLGVAVVTGVLCWGIVRLVVFFT